MKLVKNEVCVLLGKWAALSSLMCIFMLNLTVHLIASHGEYRQK